MENFLDVVISFIPTLITIILTYIIVVLFIKIKKYINIKTEYYKLKLNELKNRT
jgi:hypothetical protein